MDKQERKETKDTERLILEAAIREFSRKGYDGARTATIAAKAGVTHAMLHYYFRTKEKLFQRVFQDKITQVVDLVWHPITNTEGSLRDRLCRAVEEHFDFLAQNPQLPVFFITTFNSRPEICQDAIAEVKEIVGERLKALREDFDKARLAGEIGKVDVADLLPDIVSLNIFPFLACQLMMAATGYEPERYGEFLAARKKENVEIILKRIS